MLTKTRCIYEQYLKNGNYTTVIEGLFTWGDHRSSQGNAKELVQLAERYGYRVKSVVLTAEKHTLLERNAERHYSVPAAEFEVLYQNIYKIIDVSETVIDSTQHSPEETLEALRVII